MRRVQKQEILNMIQTLHEAQDKIKEKIDRKELNLAQDLMSQCQECAITLGTTIESEEGEGFVTVSLMEAYCEELFLAYEELNNGEVNADKIYDNLNEKLLVAEDSVKKDVRTRKEVVFLPYKASMWDSLESVWKAAAADPFCDAYVIPVPYFEKNPDGSRKEMHYELDQYPAYVPVIKYDSYDFKTRHPDAIFIHNPYDNCNFVTSVHPFFYSKNLKKFTDNLVYIPYFATSGGMSEAQSLLPAYLHADYIVIQSEKYRGFYDKRIPDQKFLALGSPKFDSVIQKCQNPPKPPAEWKDKMQGKKVYFYNTSLNGMLENTECFLKKMRYVFLTFKGRKDACLLWRPHPLLESTFSSMREQYKEEYDRLKQQFLDEEIGIYDTTPDMENTIALSDVYIGDSATSVVSLFGVVGKPLFILNNRLYEKPGEDDWKGSIFIYPREDRQNRYCILPGNRLYDSPNHDFHYEYFCDLSEFSGDGYYTGVVEYEQKAYVLPCSAQEILVVDKNKNIRKIELKHEVEQPGAFLDFLFWEDKIYLLPNLYPDLVVFDLKNEDITYIPGVSDFNITQIEGERICAAHWIFRNKMYFLNPDGTKMLVIDQKTYASEIQEVPFQRLLTAAVGKSPEDETIWLIPYAGSVITRWNLLTGEMKDFDVWVEGMTAINRNDKTECDINLFGSIAFCDDRLIISPNWGNKFVELDPHTGEAKEWIPPFPLSMQDKNAYFPNFGMGFFVRDFTDGSYRYFYAPERKIYDIDLRTKEVKEVEAVFDKEEILNHTPGFSRWSKWTQYMCPEDAFHSLEDLLDDHIYGNQFEKDRQIKEYARINASVDGDCGEKVYRFIMGNVS